MTTKFYSLLMGVCLLFLPFFVQSQCDVIPSHVTTTTSLGYLEVDSMNSQVIDVMTNSTASADYIYAVTGTDFNIIRFESGPSVDISDLLAGKYFIWGFSYTGDINLVLGELVFTGSFSTGCFQISHTAVVIQKLFDGPGAGNPCIGVDGGMMELAMGGTDTTIIIDGNPDLVSFNTTAPQVSGVNFNYVVTDANNNILGLPMGSSVDFDPAGVGNCYVYGLSYTGGLLATLGDNINGLQFSDECFDLSDNFLIINRIDTTGAVAETQFFVSSNTQGMVGIYNVMSNGTIEKDSFSSAAGDADGIYYDQNADALYQLNRSDNVINAYSDVLSSVGNGMPPTLTGTSSSDFINGREVAASGDRMVVAQDADSTNGNLNRLYLYDISPAGISLVNAYDVGIDLWGIHADGGTLYAIEDNSNRLAVYKNFFSRPAGAINASATIEIEGIIRTHGLTYDAMLDAMILTDVGDATNDSDGAFTVIPDFTDASSDGLVTMDEQVRIEGPMSMLGNPVDVAWDRDRTMIYIAERANGGGRILGFMIPSMSGDVAPDYMDDFAGASAVYIKGDEGMSFSEAQLFVSSNTTDQIGVMSVLQNNLMQLNSFTGNASDANGIYYDRSGDLLYQFNRSFNVVDIYADVAMSLTSGGFPLSLSSSTADVSNGREIAVSGSSLIVAQDADSTNGNMNQFYIYDIGGGAISMNKSYTTDIDLWGIHAEGSTLYAIVDNSNQLAIYNDFFAQPAGLVSPSAIIEIEGIVRTHGLTYDDQNDLMILTDIGDAGNDSDGAIVIIPDFLITIADSMVSLNEQIIISGDMTFLGNPVDVAYDVQRSMIYVAERANGGGQLLGFRTPEVNGNYAPMFNEVFAGASAVYLNDVDGIFFGGNDDSENYMVDPNASNTAAVPDFVTVYPNPVLDYLSVQWEQESVAPGETAIVKVIGMSGATLIEKEVQVWEGIVQVGLVLSNLKGGLYQVEVRGSSGVHHQQFFKAE